MSVHQLKDGRWIVRHSKGKDQSRPTANKKYFGRGSSAELKAINFDNKIHSSSKGTRAHRDAIIADLEKKILSLTRGVESEVRDELAFYIRLHGGSDNCACVEVQNPSGTIDILTDSEIIEVKCYAEWKKGMGQLIAYREHYPGKATRLHLFRKSQSKYSRDISPQAMANICAVAGKNGIRISLHDRHCYKNFKPFHKEIVSLF